MGKGYHHGDLRSALLVEAEGMLETSGIEGLSLRELARAVGVSHGAPRRHFADKAALLEALAIRGFHRLRNDLEAAASPDGRAFRTVMHDVAIAFVRFATGSPALVDLMSTYRRGDVSAELRHARAASFAPVAAMIETGQADGELVDDANLVGTLFFAALQGISVMANNRTIAPLHDALIVDVVDSLLHGLAPRTH